MVACNCPYCGAYANFTEKARWDDVLIPESAATKYFAAWRCDNCHRPIVGTMSPTTGGPDEFWPKAVASKSYPDVPEAIARDASEAHLCASVGAVRATVVMARRVVQAVVLAHGAKGRTLAEQIDEVAELGVISTQMRDLSHEIRFSGNAGAHPDKVVTEGGTDVGDAKDDDLVRDADDERARQALGFLDAVLLYVYQLPAQVARLQRDRDG